MNHIFTRVSIRKYQDRPVEKRKDIGNSSGCDAGAFCREPAAVEEILDMPDDLRAFAIFPYGYPAEERQQQDRFDENRIHYVE